MHVIYIICSYELMLIEKLWFTISSYFSANTFANTIM